jgi:preprotein translocase subunit YajC
MIGMDISTWLMLAEDAKPAETAPPGLPLPVLIGIFILIGYFILWRPEQRKRREFRSLLENLKEKDRVVTIGGIHGVVTNIQREADLVTVRIDDATGAKIRVNLSAIARVVVEEPSTAS